MLDPDQRRFLSRPDRVSRIHGKLPREIPGLLTLCDGVRSLAEIRALTGIEPELFARVIDKLEALGLLVACDFSQDDEAFFDRPVEDPDAFHFVLPGGAACEAPAPEAQPTARDAPAQRSSQFEAPDPRAA